MNTINQFRPLRGRMIPWTPEDDARLVELLKRHQTAAAAVILCRTFLATAERAQWLARGTGPQARQESIELGS